MPLETSGVLTAKELPCCMQAGPRNTSYSLLVEKENNEQLFEYN